MEIFQIILSIFDAFYCATQEKTAEIKFWKINKKIQYDWVI